MYTFKQKKEISRRIAKAENIDFYKRMLKPHRPSAAGRIMSDRNALAESLVYNLLDFYKEDQLVPVPADLVTSQMRRPEKLGTETQAVKKKSQNSRSIPTFSGRILTILWSALQTAYSQTVSTAGAVWQRLKEASRGLQNSLLKLFQK